MFSREPPLHDAILHDRYDLVQSLVNDETVKIKNRYGFTAIQLAQLLGKQKSLEILQPNQPQHHINVVLRGYKHAFNITTKQFPSTFGVHYASHLRLKDYNTLKQVVRNCPLILKSRLGEENQQLFQQYQHQIVSGYVANLIILWINDEIGFGAFANEDFPAECYIGEYTGLLRRLYRSKPDPNGYCFKYPTRWWSLKYFVIDALDYGNELRYVNHSVDSNLQPVCLVDLNTNLLHQVFLTSRPIKKGEQLLFNYGGDYWRNRALVKL